MFWLKAIFFSGLFVTFYSYLGYGLLVWLWLKGKQTFSKPHAPVLHHGFTPPVTLIIAAYNEAFFIKQKIENTLALDYPDDALKIIIITDGSTDATPQIVAQYPRIQLLHASKRSGKVAAMHRAMGFVKTPFVVFCDANTLLNRGSIRLMMQHYANEKVGGVAGEKKVLPAGAEAAAGAGEGLYWKYESFLKNLDWKLYSVVGAAGELFSVRTALYEHPGNDVILDDFVISLRICERGYRVAYEPGAYAMETASASMQDEQKRKVRIGAGGFQAMQRMKGLLNIFKHGVLSFQYISHRVLRWTLVPLMLPLMLMANAILVMKGAGTYYTILLIAQLFFYALALAGWMLSLQNKKVQMLYAPYYLVFINITLYLGFFRFLRGRQSVLWEKAERAAYAETKP